MSTKPVAIVCSACGAETFLKRVPKYDGFKRVGDDLYCASCGHVYADEAQVPFKDPCRPRVFSADDAPRRPDIFRGDEKGRTCRYCRHYVINPFTQRCGLHNRVVEATDTCGQFEARENADQGD